MAADKFENTEIEYLLEAIFDKYGYDFRDYAAASIKRRVLHQVSSLRLKNISALTHKALSDPVFFKSLLSSFSIHFTEMFRDPQYYKALRKEIIPILKTYPFSKIWVAGCATGEEAYSMAILLNEEGLYDRSLIYATDFEESVILQARAGIYPLSTLKKYTTNYQQAGGKRAFSDYYHADDQKAILDASLRDNIVFATHNLTSDYVFNEMQLIICRNVLIYFNRALQDRVFKLFDDSLCAGGFLCLGPQETLQFSASAADFEKFTRNKALYRKKWQK
jgi:chemotaxis protein methyltransferase CheR